MISNAITEAKHESGPFFLERQAYKLSMNKVQGLLLLPVLHGSCSFAFFLKLHGVIERENFHPWHLCDFQRLYIQLRLVFNASIRDWFIIELDRRRLHIWFSRQLRFLRNWLRRLNFVDLDRDVAFDGEKEIHLTEAFKHSHGGRQYQCLLAPELKLDVLDDIRSTVEASRFLAKLRGIYDRQAVIFGQFNELFLTLRN